MKTFAKRLASVAMAVVMAMSMAITVSAECSHTGSVYTTSMPYTSRSTHTAPNGSSCTITTTVTVYQSYCGKCGASLGTSQHTTTTHSNSSCN